MTFSTRLALWLHERTLPRDEREAIIGDLVEELTWRAESDPRAAERWVWAQTCRSALPNLRRRLFDPRPTPVTDQADGARMMHGLVTDLTFSLRLMRRQSLMTLVGLLSLSAGLGLNVLLFTLADAALFRPLPLRAPAELVLLLLQRESGLMHNFSYADYQHLRETTRTLDGLVAYSPVSATVAGAEGATSADGEVVSGTFFATLGVPLQAGRALNAADDRAGSPPAAVISERLWRERFGAAPLAERPVILNGQPYVVVGVAHGRFAGMQIGRQASFWVPLAHSRPLTGDDFLSRPETSWLTVIGRLRSGVPVEQARAELDASLRRVREAAKRPVEPLILQPGARGDSMLAEALTSPMLLLMVGGAILLLVACLNVANLQLARSEARRLELAVRAALGARKGQLVRLILVDGLVMALAAGVIGVGLAALAKDRAASLIALSGQPVSLAIPLDVRVLGGAVLLSLFAAVIIGVLSTWQIVRGAAARSLGDGRTTTPARRSMQRALVVTQVALSMGLLTGASLLVRTLDHLRHTPLGFETRGLAVLQVSPEMGRLTRPDAARYFDEAIRALEALPGVERAALAHVMPLDFGGSRTTFAVNGYAPSQNEDMEINFVRISPGYFATLGVPLLQGRAFDATDRDGQPERIIVNETMARRFWPEGRAVGGRLRFDSSGPFAVEVVGVVPDVHYRMVREEASPSFYVPLAQWPTDNGVLHVRVAGDAAPRIQELRRAVAAVNPAVPVTRAHTLVDQIERNVADERLAMGVGLTLAVVALLLATAGLYATMAFLVGRRTREIGVRMALGAATADVRALVLREGLTLALAGVAAGLVLSAWVGHALRFQIYGIGKMDAVSLLVAGVILSGAALLASWLPARRASLVDPVVALKDA